MCKDINHFQTVDDITGFSGVFMHFFYQWVYDLTAYRSHDNDDSKSVVQESILENPAGCFLPAHLFVPPFIQIPQLLLLFFGCCSNLCACSEGVLSQSQCVMRSHFCFAQHQCCLTTL